MPTPAQIREEILHILRLAGLDPVRIPGRKNLYRLSDGTVVLIRTAPKGWLTTTKGDAEDAPLHIDGQHDFVVVGVPPPRGGPTDVYKIPTARVVTDLEEAGRAYLAEHPNAANKNMRQIYFWRGQIEGGRENPLRGFGEKYREFLLLPEDEHIDDSSQTPLARALEQARAAASAEYGQPAERIRISISVMFRTGELVFHFPSYRDDVFPDR
jgi:hypothetical protein